MECPTLSASRLPKKKTPGSLSLAGRLKPSRVDPRDGGGSIAEKHSARVNQGPDCTLTRGLRAALFRRLNDLRSEEHTSELQSHHDLVCRLLLEKKKKKI